MIPEDPGPDFLDDFELFWGVYDCVDKCWVGDDKGPLLYSQIWARAAATLVNERMGTSSRYRGRVYEGGPMNKIDEVPYLYTVPQAIDRIEGRAT
jgi:hypothetical protein